MKNTADTTEFSSKIMDITVTLKSEMVHHVHRAIRDFSDDFLKRWHVVPARRPTVTQSNLPAYKTWSSLGLPNSGHQVVANFLSDYYSNLSCSFLFGTGDYLNFLQSSSIIF